MAALEEHLWWQRGVIYQVYPRSFADSDGNGVGDLSGIAGKLDYLRWLGVDALWISPIYPSPMVDFGYDVADYTAVDPVFGSMEQFDALLAGSHARDMHVIMDFVPNHTSDQHAWFAESRSSRDNARRDWYLWRDAAPDGGPPNNWLSEFGGSAWQWDDTTRQYYYHAFAVEQPDLNWRNADVRAAMFDVMRFWLDRGVDGFRVDVMWHLIKDEQWRNNPLNPDYTPGMPEYQRLVPTYSTDQAGVHEVVALMRRVLDEYAERLMIGEIYLPVGRLVNYYGHEGQGANLPFNFHLVTTPWNAREIQLAVDRYEGVLPPNAWPNWVLGNHDQSRVASRIGPAQARVAAVLLLTLRGTPTIYYGEEIGMHDVPIPSEMAHDPRELNAPGRGLGRDPFRTPMQWTAGGGFTDGEPWLPIADDAATLNVETERSQAGSMLSLYRRLLELRAAEPALSVGSYAPLPASGDLLAFTRRFEGRQLLVAMTLAPGAGSVDLAGRAGRVLLSSNGDREGEAVAGTLDVGPDEALVLELNGAA